MLMLHHIELDEDNCDFKLSVENNCDRNILVAGE